MSEPVVCLVFAKPPRNGGAKSRLAAGAGPTQALAEAFLRDTWSVATATPGLWPVLATSDPSADHGLPPGSEALLVGDGELRLSDVIEDELILALPIVPTKPGADDAEEIVYSTENAEARAREHPFAALDSIKKQ